MDEQTEELRELFVETTGEETVTESQEAERGDLSADVADADADERIQELLGRMRERYEFASGLNDDALRRIVRGFYADESDAELARAIEEAEETVFLARMDLHLLRETDFEAPFPIADLRELIVADVPLDERIEQLDTDRETVEHYSRVIETDLQSTRANDRFTDEFADLLTDADLRDSHTGDAHETGLEEATEDLETNTQL